MERSLVQVETVPQDELKFGGKMSVREALEKYSVMQLKEDKRKRKNKKPEKDVQIECQQWFSMQGWDGNIYEAKGGYNNTYGIIAVVAGHPDWAGNDQMGRSCWVEFKAKGRISTLQYNQRLFLLRKIDTNCFAIVTDSVERLRDTYNVWSGIIGNRSFNRARKYLKDILPQPSKKYIDDGSELFPE